MKYKITTNCINEVFKPFTLEQHSLINVMDKGWINIKDLKVGDILTPNVKYKDVDFHSVLLENIRKDVLPPEGIEHTPDFLNVYFCRYSNIKDHSVKLVSKNEEFIYNIGAVLKAFDVMNEITSSAEYYTLSVRCVIDLIHFVNKISMFNRDKRMRLIRSIFNAKIKVKEIECVDEDCTSRVQEVICCC